MAGTDTGIYVVATTLEGTRTALCRSRELSAGHRRIVLLVAVPCGPDAGARASASIDEHSHLAASMDITASPYALLCRHPSEIFLWFPVGPDATVVVGDDEPLARALRATEHQVVSVCSASQDF